MSATVTIVSLFPDLLNINGDAANATVLETRARWSGLDCRLARVGVGDDVGPERPEIVVIGSGSDAELPVALAELRRIEGSLREWVTHDVPILAIGTSWELLSDYVDTGTQPPLEGLGIFSGHAAPAPRRIASELVVDSPFGRLFGFENHARSYSIGAQCQPLGTVVHGTGNGEGAREGVLIGNLVGTHLHGPVLAEPDLSRSIVVNCHSAYRKFDGERHQRRIANR